jgi:hypothetical protein
MRRVGTIMITAAAKNSAHKLARKLVRAVNISSRVGIRAKA